MNRPGEAFALGRSVGGGIASQPASHNRYSAVRERSKRNSVGGFPSFLFFPGSFPPIESNRPSIGRRHDRARETRGGERPGRERARARDETSGVFSLFFARVSSCTEITLGVVDSVDSRSVNSQKRGIFQPKSTHSARRDDRRPRRRSRRPRRRRRRVEESSRRCEGRGRLRLRLRDERETRRRRERRIGRRDTSKF